MVRAYWNGVELAASADTILVENNHYFPRADVREAFLEESTHTSRCPWKGLAHYYTLVVDGKRNENAAWVYPEPKEKALSIKGRIAFWKGVEVREDEA